MADVTLSSVVGGGVTPVWKPLGSVLINSPDYLVFRGKFLKSTITLPVSGGRLYECNNLLFLIPLNPTSIIYTSADGRNWTARTLPVSAQLEGVAYGNSTYVIVSSGSTKHFYSADAVTWNSTDVISKPSLELLFANGIFIELFNSTTEYRVSSDGVTWTMRSFPAGLSYRPSIGYGNGKFVMVTSNEAWTSLDAITWIPMATLPMAATNTYILFLNGVFLAYQNAVYYYATSTDGINWTEREGLPGGLSLEGSRVVNNYIITRGSDRVFVTSDCINWFFLENYDAMNYNYMVNIGDEYLSASTTNKIGIGKMPDKELVYEAPV